MRKLLVVTAILALFVGGAFADAAQSDFRGDIGHVKSDTVKWYASGSIPGTSGVRVDTLVAGTLIDTSHAVKIAGAEGIAVEIISRGIEDDCDFTIQPQFSQSPLIAASWHSIVSSYSVDNTAGSEVSGADDTAKDTTFYLMLPRAGAYPDSAAGQASHTGMTIPSQPDQYLIGNSQYMRFIISPDASAGDTTYITAITTIVYPR